MDFVNWLKVERERVAAWSSIVLGGTCLVAGWIGVSGTKETYQQITYVVSGGISSLFFLGLGVGLLVSADLHDEWRKMDRLERALTDRALPPGSSDTGPGGSGAITGEDRVTIDLSGGAAAVMAAVESRPTALRRRDITIAGGGLTLALVLLAGGWLRASGTVQARTALDGLFIAMAALVACGLSMAGYSLQIGRAVGLRKRRLFAGLADDGGRERAPWVETAPDGLFMADGGVRFHRAGCPILALHTVTPYRPGLHRDAVPCDLCDAQ